MDIRLKRDLFLGSGTLKKGTVVPIEDMKRARELVQLGHAEFAVKIQRAVAPGASENAKAPNAG